MTVAKIRMTIGSKGTNSRVIEEGGFFLFVFVFLIRTHVTSAGFEILVKWPMCFTVPHCGINTEVTFQP